MKPEEAAIEIVSLQRRLRLALAAAEKHHAGDRAACARENQLRERLSVCEARCAMLEAKLADRADMEQR